MLLTSLLVIFLQKLGKKDVWNVPVTDMLAKEGLNETVDFRDASLTIDASAHVRLLPYHDVPSHIPSHFKPINPQSRLPLTGLLEKSRGSPQQDHVSRWWTGK